MRTKTEIIDTLEELVDTECSDIVVQNLLQTSMLEVLVDIRDVLDKDNK